jgi:glyoxylase-like metal-dependent hydrolase (beta-lactamase superfamily II)
MGFLGSRDTVYCWSLGNKGKTMVVQSKGKQKWRSMAAVFLTLLLVLGGLWLTQPLHSQNLTTIPQLAKAGVTLQEVAPKVYALITETDFPTKEGSAICNGGFIVGSDGVMVIDPFQTPELAEAVFAQVKAVTDQPIKYVLNTHYHFDHTGGNPAALKRGIPIIGRGKIREFIATKRNINSQFPDTVPPSVIINSDTDLWLGDRQVQLARVDGHSAGTDLVAYVPDAKVLFTGDMVFNKRIPYAGDSDIRQWQGSLYRLMVTYPDAKTVPGHGAVGTIADLQTQQQYFNDLERLALNWKAQNLSKEQVLRDFAKVPDTYKDYKFQSLYSTNLNAAYDQFTQSATIPLIP